MASWLTQLDPGRPGGAISAVLASFHSSMLVLVAIALLYLLGDLGEALADLNSLVGLGLFAYLWTVTWVTSAGALRRLRWPVHPTAGATLAASMLWGGLTGVGVLVAPVLFATAAFVVVGVATLDAGVVAAALLVPVAGVIAALFAFAIGAWIGSIFGLLDYLLLLAARSVIAEGVADHEARAGREIG